MEVSPIGSVSCSFPVHPLPKWPLRHLIPAVALDGALFSISQLKLLQEEYGITLFKKNGRWLELTETGRAFLRDVEPITAQIEGFESEISGRGALQATDSLSVGGSHGPSVSVLSYVMTQFKKGHPGAELHLKTATSAVIEELVLRHQLDIAVITNPFATPFLKMELSAKKFSRYLWPRTVLWQQGRD